MGEKQPDVKTGTALNIVKNACFEASVGLQFLYGY